MVFRVYYDINHLIGVWVALLRVGHMAWASTIRVALGAATVKNINN
jgi:hypothetical protein